MRLSFKMVEKQDSNLNTEKILDYTHFLVMPLKIVGCYDWYRNPTEEYQKIINYVYLCMVLFVLLSSPVALLVNLYTEWTDIMESLEKIADGLPLIVSVAIVAYFGANKSEMYELIDYMNVNFKYYSANGLSNMTMRQSYIRARNFAYFYTACTLFSVTMYVLMPIVVHLVTKQPLQLWVYMDVTTAPIFVVVFLRHALGQAFVGLAMGQLGVFFAANAILLCGQYDLLCCSLRNARYTALLKCGVAHSAIKTAFSDIVDDEKYNYIYTEAELKESSYHYDGKMHIVLAGIRDFIESSTPQLLFEVDRIQRDNNYRLNLFSGKVSQFDINNRIYDEATSRALNECARVGQVANQYKLMFERFVSPLLAIRVVQVTLYLCTLLYAATLKFDMITVEYLGAVALDIFVYCYFGNQIILQASRVSLSAYQSAWATMGVKPRRILLNILLANNRPVMIRAGRFLPMDLHTFVVIIKTSFSYYTLLVNVNEKK